MSRKMNSAPTRKVPTKKTKTMSTTSADRQTADKPRKRKPPTIHKLVWRDVTCRVRHTRDYLSEGWSHIEIIVLAPKDAPLPITQTGYLSHFLEEEELTKSGGPVTFFRAWLDREAKTATWAKADFKWRQLELFPR